MLTKRQINTLFPFLTEKNNNDIYQSRIPRCLFGKPDGADELFKKSTLRDQENFLHQWDYDVVGDVALKSPKNYDWRLFPNRSELCNSSETNSSENLVTSEQDGRYRAEKEMRPRLKRCCDPSWQIPHKKKRQMELTEIWREKKTAPLTASQKAS